MRIAALPVVIIFALIASAAFAQDAVKLEPNAKLSFEFPDLPETYFAHFHKSTGEAPPAMLTAQLPENYTPDGKFPILVFLNGGNGGRGDGASYGRRIVGPRDYIVVNLPLFKDTNHRPATQPAALKGTDAATLGYIITMNDYPVISSAYHAMLQKLFDTVPNITAQGSAIGGFSNGAHTTSVLLGGKDEFIMKHFTSYILLEGGGGLLTNPEVLQDPAAKDFRILLLFGDQTDIPNRKKTKQSIETAVQQCKARGMDCTFIVMTGYGHETPPEYLKLIGNWIRGEALPQIAAHTPTHAKSTTQNSPLENN